MSRIAHSAAKSDILCAGRWKPSQPLICSVEPQRIRRGELRADRDVSCQSAVLSLESSRPQPEYTMNIFYIIGVIVVVLFVAGFFGLHV
jgi:hypothetical protein